MRTAQRLGWRTVAIHTDLDAGAPHARGADRVVRVESYLDVDAVVAAARESGAGYVHPGYGFLSERAPFARALAEAGITLVGPSADVMDAMGRKDAAREVAVAAGVPVVPSYSLTDPTPSTRPPSPTRCWSRRPPAAAARGCASCGARATTTRPSPRRSARRGRRSATTRSWSRSTSSPAATSRCRSWATPTARCCTSSSATAPPSAATRRCWRRRPPRRSARSSARRSRRRPWRSPSSAATPAPARSSSCSTTRPGSSSSSR